jgi:ankyrin repeat protein
MQQVIRAVQGVARLSWPTARVGVSSLLSSSCAGNVARVAREGHIAAYSSNHGPSDADSELFSELHRAAFEGNLRGLRKSLAGGAQPNIATHKLRLTPLHLATANGHIEAVAELLNTPGINVHATDSDADRLSPPFVAAKCGHPDILALYLEDPKAAISPNLATEAGMTLLHAAAACPSEAKSLECVQLLLDRGATVNVLDSLGLTPLHEAARAGHLPVVALLLANGADPNLRELVSSEDTVDVDYTAPIGLTPLHLAAFSAHSRSGIELVQRLLEAGASAELPDDLGNTALHAAVSKKRLDDQNKTESIESLNYQEAVVDFVVKAILDKGVSINAAIISGATALHLAASNGWGSAVMTLLEAGADPRIADKNGLLPEHYAAKSLERELETMLVASRQYWENATPKA